MQTVFPNAISVLSAQCERVRVWLQQPLEGVQHGALAAKLRLPAARQLFEALLWIVAAMGLGGASFTYSSAYLHQAKQRKLAAQAIVEKSRIPAAGSTVHEVSVKSPPVRGELLGTLEIPALGIRSVVEEGDDEETLSRATGHLPGTKFPGEPGTAALAAHRDTYFRHLREAKPGHKITYRNADGEFVYTVESTRVVDPGDVGILADSEVSTLTLITCYPFRFIGPAPQRFVVTARLVHASEGSER